MKATTFSSEHYYPMSMASGRDAVLVDYGGSNFLSMNGHTHFEPHQGAPVGWYKAANMHKGEALQPIIMAGVQVVLFGAPAEPVSFEQSFIPERATVSTVLKFRCGIVLRITSFFTYGDSIWCEKVEAIHIPDGLDVKIAFRLHEPVYGTALGRFPRTASIDFESLSANELDFSYDIGCYTGRGSLVASADFANISLQKSCIDGYYYDIKSGFCVSRAMIVLGDNERHTTYAELKSKASLGYDELYKSHLSDWDNYFSTSSVSLENKKLEHVYNLSRYLMRAHQHPDSGLIALGMQPNHWGGALSCSWDSEFSHDALLQCGNFKEAEAYTDSYLRLSAEGYEAVRNHGLEGLSFSGWTNILGDFAGMRDFDEWVLDFKPMFSAYAIHAVYKEWKKNPYAEVLKYKDICVDVLKFWLCHLVNKGSDGLYYLAQIKDGGESGVDASIDSFTQLDFAKAFLYVGEMYSLPEYTDIGRRMLLALEMNRRPDGYLASYKGSPYRFVSPLNYYYTYQDGLVSEEKLMDMIDGMKTPWGMDNELAAEEYRAWPWYDSLSARAFVLMKNSARASEHLLNSVRITSSLGALPEKVRLDGFPIGYYYTSPHAVAVSAVCEAFALLKGDSELLIGYGFNSESGSFSCSNIRTARGICVSVSVEDGALKKLEISNFSKKEINIALSINPVISAENIPSLLTVKPGEKLSVK